VRYLLATQEREQVREFVEIVQAHAAEREEKIMTYASVNLLGLPRRTQTDMN
jgi:hypothetical protein